MMKAADCGNRWRAGRGQLAELGCRVALLEEQARQREEICVGTLSLRERPGGAATARQTGPGRFRRHVSAPREWERPGPGGANPRPGFHVCGLLALAGAPGAADGAAPRRGSRRSIAVS